MARIIPLKSPKSNIIQRDSKAFSTAITASENARIEDGDPEQKEYRQPANTDGITSLNRGKSRRPSRPPEASQLQRTGKSKLPQTEPDDFQECLIDCETLNDAELTAKYPLSWASIKDKLSKCATGNSNGFSLDPAWKGKAGLRNLLRELGPRGHILLTLDRINPHYMTYGPGHCRWADKQTQADNQRRTRFLTQSSTGRTRTVSRWADLTGQKANTMRKRMREGWTDDEVISGMRLHAAPQCRNGFRWPVSDEAQSTWEMKYRAECQTGEPQWMYAERITIIMLRRRLWEVFPGRRIPHELYGSPNCDGEIVKPGMADLVREIAQEIIEQVREEIEAGVPFVEAAAEADANLVDMYETCAWYVEIIEYYAALGRDEFDREKKAKASSKQRSKAIAEGKYSSWRDSLIVPKVEFSVPPKLKRLTDDRVSK